MAPDLLISRPGNAASAIAIAGQQDEFERTSVVSLTVVDASVTNAEHLIAQIARNTEVIVLDAGIDGINQITDALFEYDSVSSLNVVSHGQSGQIQLGSSTIDSRTLTQYTDQFQSWQQALTDHADILFYGCNVAAGQAGTDLIDRLAQLTGADIAASSDLTGSRSLGGDWTLEYSTGDIESDLDLRLGETEPYHSILSITSNPVDSNPPPAGQGETAGYRGIVDTYLHSSTPAANNSRATTLIADTEDGGGQVQSLIRFDNIFGHQTGQIPENSMIVSATLVLHITNPGSSLELHDMLADWSDTATWSSVGDGIQTDGQEAASDPIASTGPVSRTGILSVDVTASVQAWQDNPSSNFGWVLLPTGSNGVDFYSAEGEMGPRLVVQTADRGDRSQTTITFNSDSSSQRHRNTGDVQLGAGNIYSKNLFELDSLNEIGLQMARVPVQMHQYWDGTNATPEQMDEVVLEALTKGIQPVLLFEYYTKDGEPLGDHHQWQSIGQAFAERFSPNSEWLLSQGIANAGIEHYTAINEPLVRHNTTPIGVAEYVDALEGLADGVKAVDSGLQVAPGGFMETPLFQGANQYIEALVPLYNSGKLDAIDIHRYWDMNYVPMEGTRNFSLQSQYEELIRELGITADTSFWTTEINFKKRDVSEEEAASGLLTALWDALGVINPNTGERATQFVMPWGMLHSTSGDSKYGMSFDADAWVPTSRGTVVDLVDELSFGMEFVQLDPHDRGEYTLSGGGKTLRVWQNRDGWSSVSGPIYTLDDIPSGATTVEIYGWDGLRETVQLNGETSVTFDELPTEETLMFLIHAGDELINPVNDGPINDNPISDSPANTDPINDAPVASDDSIDVDEDNAVTIAVLANDSNSNGDSLTIESFTDPSDGTVVYRGDGTFTYTPKPDFNGSDRFTYTIHNGRGSTDTATVEIAVNSVNDRPQASDDSVGVNENSAVTINVLSNDTDLDSDKHSDSNNHSLTIERFTEPSHGTVTDLGDGRLTYTPKRNFNGSDRFSYTIRDRDGGTDTAIVSIAVTPLKKESDAKLIDLNRNKRKAAERKLDSSQEEDSAFDAALAERKAERRRNKNRQRRLRRRLKRLARFTQ